MQQRRRRLAGETDEVRQARLQRMTDRLADETAEEREARPQQMTASNHARLAAEIAEEREARLQSDRVRYRQKGKSVSIQVRTYTSAIASPGLLQDGVALCLTSSRLIQPLKHHSP